MARTKSTKATTPAPRIELTPRQLLELRVSTNERIAQNANAEFREAMASVGVALRRAADEADRYLEGVDHPEHPTAVTNAAEWMINSTMWVIPNLHMEAIMRKAYHAERTRAQVADARAALAKFDAATESNPEILFEVCKTCAKPQNECDCR